MYFFPNSRLRRCQSFEFEQRAIVYHKFNDEKYRIRLHGVYWRAKSASANSSFEIGEKVRIIGRDSLTLIIEKLPL